MSEYLEISDKYYQKFGDHFPTMCFPTDSLEDTKRKMQECLDQGKDAWELFNLSKDLDTFY